MVQIIFAIFAFSNSTLAGSPPKQESQQCQTVYTDKHSKLSWCKGLANKLSNGCIDDKGECNSGWCTSESDSDGGYRVKIDDSQAAMACRSIGARLPTVKEILSLIKNFDYTEEKYGPTLSKKGMADLQGYFGNLDPEDFFWSSTVDSIYPYCSYAFISHAGDVANIYRCYKHEVRCVTDPDFGGERELLDPPF